MTWMQQHMARRNPPGLWGIKEKEPFHAKAAREEVLRNARFQNETVKGRCSRNSADNTHADTRYCYFVFCT